MSSKDPPPPKSLGHFLSIPWCAAHLTSPNITPLDPSWGSSRTRKPGQNAFFAGTLSTPSTVPHIMLFYPTPATLTGPLPEMNAFLTLGTALDGWPGVAHGGVVMSILDEVLGSLVPMSMRLGRMKRMGLMTAYLNTRFKKPARTGRTVLVTARLVKVEGRKHFLEGEVRDEEGEVLAEADALFMILKEGGRKIHL